MSVSKKLSTPHSLENSSENTLEEGARAILHIEAFSFGGEGIGRVHDDEGNPSGKKIFVPYTIPGETVEVSIVKNEKNFARAHLENIITSSQERIPSPPCPYFGTCGGCQLQHITLAEQRQLKLNMVQGFFERQLGQTPRLGCTMVATGEQGYGYRNRVRLKVQDGELGYYGQSSHTFVAIRECLLAEPVLNTALQCLRADPALIPENASDVLLERIQEKVAVLVYAGRTQVSCLLYEAGSLMPCSEDILKNQELIEESSLEHFSQVNEQANTHLVQTVVSLVDAQEVLDLYAGSGNFSLPLARTGKKVSAVELSKKLCTLGQAKAEQENLSLRFYNFSCEKYHIPEHFSGCILLDPPRRGAKEILNNILRSQASQIMYVSCSLPELCRDLKVLLQGPYTFEQAFVVDMFPQTGHVEVVVSLSRSASHL